MAIETSPMDKQDQKRPKGWARLRKQRGDTETTKLYTPEELEAMTREQANGNGIMRLHTGELRLPKSLEEPADGKRNDSAFRVMLVIVILMLLFIAIITYFVAQMPDKV
jgi:hypothetical protein